MKLTGKNFQPWADFELDIDKLTVLTGPSNKGKSSLFRALMGIVRNDIAAAFIRDPKKEALELTLTLDDGMTIKATRDKRGKVKYVINGDEKNAYTSLDGMLPEPMQDLGFKEITVGEFTFDPIFGQQNSPQFLLDKKAYKPGDMNAILGAFGGTEKLEAGKKEAAARVSEKNSEAKTLATEIRQAEERKMALEPMAATATGLVMMVNTLEKDVQGYGEQTYWLTKAGQHAHRVLRLRTLRDGMTLPDPSQAEKQARIASYAQQGVDSYLYTKFLKKLATVQQAASEPWTAAMTQYRKLVALENARSLLGSRRTAPDISGIEASYYEGIRLYQSIKRVSEIVALRESVQQKRNELIEIDRKLTEAQEELRKGSCPKCGKPIEHVCTSAGGGE